MVAVVAALTDNIKSRVFLHSATTSGQRCWALKFKSSPVILLGFFVSHRQG
jgi:hypothetical protein